MRDDRGGELADLVGALAPEDGVHDTDWPGLLVSRASAPMPRVPVPYRPSLCVVVQGRKQIFLGDETFTYDPLHYLVIPLALPLEMEIGRASREKPVLGLGLEFDMATVSELLLSIDDSPSPKQTAGPDPQAIFVSRIDTAMQDAMIRLLRLLSDPTELRILGPSVVREILFRSLQSEQGGQLRRLVLRDGGSHRIASLIRYLHENLTEPLSIEDIAGVAGMSTSTLHHKFRDVTGMSPIQFLKKILLHHARMLMVDQGLNAGEAGYQVGYATPSQFSREFKRLFGLPPGQAVRGVLGAVD